MKPRNLPPAWNGLREFWECRAGGHSAKVNVGIGVLDIDVGLPGVGEGGMPGRDEQRKLGTTRGSPRRSRTAKASRISRHAVKSRCACEWGGWGRLSDDGPGQNNPDPSEGPWGRWSIPPHGGAQSSPQARRRAVPSMRPRGARRADANRSWPVYAGSRLKLDYHLGRRRPKASLPAVLGKTRRTE